MTRLQWGQIGSRLYQAGLEHGVIYLPDGRAVVWNGLASIEEELEGGSQPFHMDGVKYLDTVVFGDFSGRLRAFTYPDEFEALQGNREVAQGLFATDQRPRLFNLAYRTRIGNDLNGDDHGYRIHILYNVFAIPQAVDNETLGGDIEPVEFEWALVCTPEAVAGFRPTAHAIIESITAEPELLDGLEALLFGTDETDPELPSLQELTDLAVSLASIVITDHGDGTWSADGPSRYFEIVDDYFEIDQVDATYLDADTYEVETTLPTA